MKFRRVLLWHCSILNLYNQMTTWAKEDWFGGISWHDDGFISNLFWFKFGTSATLRKGEMVNRFEAVGANGIAKEWKYSDTVEKLVKDNEKNTDFELVHIITSTIRIVIVVN